MSYKVFWLTEKNALDNEKICYEEELEMNGNHVLVIEDNEVRWTFSDMNAEPEDRTFNRDYDWIKGALHAAYAAGVRDSEIIKKEIASENDWYTVWDILDRLGVLDRFVLMKTPSGEIKGPMGFKSAIKDILLNASCYLKLEDIRIKIFNY